MARFDLFTLFSVSVLALGARFPSSFRVNASRGIATGVPRGAGHPLSLTTLFGSPGSLVVLTTVQLEPVLPDPVLAPSYAWLPVAGPRAKYLAGDGHRCILHALPCSLILEWAELCTGSPLSWTVGLGS